MSALETKLDLKTVIAIAGALASLSGVFATWTLLQYRLDQMEEQVTAMHERQRQTEKLLAAQAAEIRCQICSVHAIPCPGCS